MFQLKRFLNSPIFELDFKEIVNFVVWISRTGTAAGWIDKFDPVKKWWHSLGITYQSFRDYFGSVEALLTHISFLFLVIGEDVADDDIAPWKLERNNILFIHNVCSLEHVHGKDYGKS